MEVSTDAPALAAATKVAVPDPEPWRKGPRQKSGELLLMEVPKPSVKLLETESRRQTHVCFQQLQKDLDLLHDQLHKEIYEALKHELAAVAHSISAVRAHAADEVRTTIARDVTPQREELATLRAELVAGLERLQGDATRSHAEARNEARESVDALRRDSQGWAEEMRDALGRLGDTVAKSSSELRADVDACRAVGGGLDADCKEQLRKLEELCNDGANARASLAAEFESAQAELSDTLEQKLQEAFAIAQDTTESRCNELASVAEAAVAELENRIAAASKDEELKSAMTELKSTFEGKIRAVTGVAADRYKAIDEQVVTLNKSMQETQEGLKGLRQECKERIAFTEACWARSIDWKAPLELNQLEQDGKLDLESPPFSAAGLSGLRLRLNLEALSPGQHVPLDATEQLVPGYPGAAMARSRRWVIGAYLAAPDCEGQISFRLHICGRTQSFTARFGDAPTHGSARIASVDWADLEAASNGFAVRLEIVDVSTGVAVTSKADSGREILRAVTHIADAEVAACREASALKASMVRRVEWKVARIRERVRQAGRALEDRTQDDEALEPICSPPFSAAGLEGLQLQLYPVGYRPRGDGLCGLFLVCPRGVFLRCRAFVADASRVFEHTFEAREPYGRSGMCRLEDKADAEDTVTCGIEVLEVRQELVAQVRGGPFGNVTDQLKVTLNPNVSSMDMVRELRELPLAGQEQRTQRRATLTKKNRTASAGGFHAVATSSRSREWPEAPPPRLGTTCQPPPGSQGVLLPCALAASKSLPALSPGDTVASWSSPGSRVVAEAATASREVGSAVKLLPKI